MSLQVLGTHADYYVFETTLKEQPEEEEATLGELCPLLLKDLQILLLRYSLSNRSCAALLYCKAVIL